MRLNRTAGVPMNLILLCLLGLGEVAVTVCAFWFIMRVLGGRRKSLSD